MDEKQFPSSKRRTHFRFSDSLSLVRDMPTVMKIGGSHSRLERRLLRRSL